MFDSVVFRIKYQNDKILKRGKFADWDIRIISSDNESMGYHNIHNFLNIRNNYKKADTRNFLVTKTEFKSIKERVEKLNEKYGIPKRWRAAKEYGYFTIMGDDTITEYIDNNVLEDENRYNLGNYFKTEEEAQKVIDSKEWKEFWAKIKAGEIGGDE